MKKGRKFLKKLVMMLIIPAVTYTIFFILCTVRGVKGFGVGSDFTVMLRNTIYTGFIALAVSYNLTSGRFDFAVGSTLILSTIMGGLITTNLGLGPVTMLGFSLLFGAVIGAVSGIAYVVLKIPPMVVSLGMAMIYEAIGFLLTGGSGVKLIGRSDLLIWANGPHIYILCAGIVAILFILLGYTKFGYDTRSLCTGQEIAVNLGINEKRNTVICYIVAGVCLAAAGVINMCVLGTVTPELGLGSASYIQNAFLPMFIGNLLAKYCDRNTGVIAGALTQAIIFAGIGKLGVPSAWQSVITGSICLLFFAYSCNSYKLVEMQMFKEKKERALAALENMDKEKA